MLFAHNPSAANGRKGWLPDLVTLGKSSTNPEWPWPFHQVLTTASRSFVHSPQCSLLPTLLNKILFRYKLFSLKKKKDFIYLYLDRGKEREKERERNINVRLPLTRPQPGTWPATQACALTGNRTSNPLVRRPALNLISHTSKGRYNLFYKILCDLSTNYFILTYLIFTILSLFPQELISSWRAGTES